MAAPTNPPLPVLSTRVPQPRFGPRAKQIGVRLYAVVWFATAAISVGLGAYGTFVAVNVYHEEVARYLVAARSEWTLQVLPQTADPGSNPPTYMKLIADQRWFVDLERRKASGYSETAEEQAIVASWENTYPFNPDTSSAYLWPAIIAAITALVTFGPILLLSLLQWIVTGRRRFGFRL